MLKLEIHSNFPSRIPDLSTWPSWGCGGVGGVGSTPLAVYHLPNGPSHSWETSTTRITFMHEEMPQNRFSTQIACDTSHLLLHGELAKGIIYCSTSLGGSSVWQNLHDLDGSCDRTYKTDSSSEHLHYSHWNASKHCFRLPGACFSKAPKSFRTQKL